MSTINALPNEKIRRANPLFSQIRTTIESAFYANNMTPVTNLKQAYELAATSPGTIKTDIPIKHTEEIGLPKEAVVLVDNHGSVIGRTAAARRILGEPNIDEAYFAGIIREAIYQGTAKQFYTGSVYVGLAPQFIVKAHLAIPKGFESNLLSYLLNFQIVNDAFDTVYADSTPYEEGDIYVYADPDWQHPDFPNGLAFFDAKHNVACILGMRYFGELKKGTLTLAWTIAHRHHFLACHGGLKSFHLGEAKGNRTYAMFGLSGSGKSTLTHAKHNHQFDITVLHDDAFVVNMEDGSSVALEPSYFDKTNDYPMGNPEVDYFMTVQNVGITLNDQGQKVLVTEDLRNGNGRTIKSRYASDNRVDEEETPINAIFWIMKDDALPPIMRVTDPALAATFGLTLATKRSSAENVVGDADLNALVIEPFANPFRVYPLSEDYSAFKQLFEQRQLPCYLINTGEFMGRKVTKEITLGLIEGLVKNTLHFEDFGPFTDWQYIKDPAFPVPFDDPAYIEKLGKRLQIRSNFIQDYNDNHVDQIPSECSKILAEFNHRLSMVTE